LVSWYQTRWNVRYIGERLGLSSGDDRVIARVAWNPHMNIKVRAFATNGCESELLYVDCNPHVYWSSVLSLYRYLVGLLPCRAQDEPVVSIHHIASRAWNRRINGGQNRNKAAFYFAERHTLAWNV